jgi:hypothetical protein
MNTRAVNIDDGEKETICPVGEGGGNREIIDGVVQKLQHLIIPGRD